jgi:hypothetical protein
MAAVLRAQHAPGAVFGQQEITDTIAPVWPGGATLNLVGKTDTTITVEASANATDNVGVAGYEWSFDNGSSYPFTSLTKTFPYEALTKITLYPLRVRAYDGAGNRSAHLPLSVTTYREGALASDVIANTAPGGGSAAGWLHDLALISATGDWLSYVILSGPTPGGGTLTANPDGSSSYTGPDAATLTIQRYVNDTAESGTTTITLYDQSFTATVSGLSAVIRTATGSVNVTLIDPVATVAASVAGLASVIRTATGLIDVTLIALPSTVAADVAGVSSVIRTATGSVDVTLIALPLGTVSADVAGLASVVRLAVGSVTLSIEPPSGEFLNSAPPAAEVDLTVEQGTDYAQSFRRRDSAGVIIDLTGFAARMQVRRSVSARTFLLELTTENGGLVIDGPAGQITIAIRDDQTTGARWRRGRYDLELISPAGRISRFLFGRLELSREVTRVGD